MVIPKANHQQLPGTKRNRQSWIPLSVSSTGSQNHQSGIRIALLGIGIARSGIRIALSVSSPGSQNSPGLQHSPGSQHSTGLQHRTSSQHSTASQHSTGSQHRFTELPVRHNTYHHWLKDKLKITYHHKLKDYRKKLRSTTGSRQI